MTAVTLLAFHVLGVCLIKIRMVFTGCGGGKAEVLGSKQEIGVDQCFLTLVVTVFRKQQFCIITNTII